MSGSIEKTGGCECGRIRYRAKVDPAEAYLCHCRMCQKATGGFAAAFVHLAVADCTWETEPDWYDSSPIARRPFCSHCGSPLGFRFKQGSENMDLTVGSFDDTSDFVPQHHFGVEALHEVWLDTSTLPRKKTTDYEPMVQMWKDATGSLPE
ncbi:MAG: GFA family protein [Erythrobacter sp.]